MEPISDRHALVFAGTHARAENVRSHAHPCRELILVIEGQCQVDSERFTLQAGPGDLIRMPARLMHNQVSDGFISTVYVGFTAPTPEPPQPQVVRLEDPQLIQQSMLMLARVHMHQAAACASSAAALLLAVVEEVDHQSHSNQRSRQIPVQLQDVLRYIEQHFHEPIAVEDIAAHARMSTSNLHKLFREHLDTSPYRHLLALRMQRAQQYLHDPYLSVKEIARLCGYPDVNLFVRTFRQVNGVPPGRWRHTQGVGSSGPAGR